MPCNFISSCFFIESPWNRDPDCVVPEESRAAAVAAIVEGVPGGGGGGGQPIPDGAAGDGGWNLRIGDRNQRHPNHLQQNFEEEGVAGEDINNPWQQQQPPAAPPGFLNIRGRRASSAPINHQPGNNSTTAGTNGPQNGGVVQETATPPSGKEAGTKAGSHTRAAKTFRAYLPSCHRTYSCVHCRAHLANHDELISKSFQGSQGMKIIKLYFISKQSNYKIINTSIIRGCKNINIFRSGLPFQFCGKYWLRSSGGARPSNGPSCRGRHIL